MALNTPKILTSFSDHCIFCNHRIKVILNSDQLKAKMAYWMKLKDWQRHKIKCEADYWQGTMS